MPVAYVQGHCPAMMSPTDLVFLEPDLLLVDDPSALGQSAWRAIRRVAESVHQIITKKDVRWSHSRLTKWSGKFCFGDAVPVSLHSLSASET